MASTRPRMSWKSNPSTRIWEGATVRFESGVPPDPKSMSHLSYLVPFCDTYDTRPCGLEWGMGDSLGQSLRNCAPQTFLFFSAPRLVANLRNPARSRMGFSGFEPHSCTLAEYPADQVRHVSVPASRSQPECISGLSLFMSTSCSCD